MALDYLDCGSTALDKATHRWASRHGYVVVTSSTGGGTVIWGQ